MLPDALAPLLPSTPADAFVQRALSGQSAVWDAALTAREVIATLEAHRIGPLVCAQLPPDAWTTLPMELQTWVKASARRQALLDIQQTLALRELLALARDRGAPVLLLKGVPTSHRHYAEPHHRVKTDVDALIRPADRDAFIKLLEELGYLRSDGLTGTLVNRQVTLTRGDVAVDVHWSVSNTALFAHALDFDTMWAERAPIPALGEAAYGPSDEDLFLHACFHLAVHLSYEFALVWLYDIHLMASRWAPEALERCLRRAGRLRILRVCLACLALSRAWFGTPYAEEVCAGLAREAAPELSARTLACRLSRLSRLQMELAALSWRERFILLREVTLPPADYLRRRYADATTWLPWLHARRWLGLRGQASPRTESRR
ncbi:MAG: hypothetical protein CFK52_06715 [Chloracidobacterium sp. CP2_5A]|nr:MAG: hypothetical protein CFK52_06715 [Chloracidobacterium sp. CP2_5A]